jgi:hypothetical protein
MPWKNIDHFNFKENHEGIAIDEIEPLSERAVSLIARNQSALILKHAFVNIYGAIEMMQGLTYHHAVFMSLVESCHETVPTIQITRALRHEAVAYINRVGQFWAFTQSDLVKQYCPPHENLLPTIDKLIPFRNKHTAHRSIDAPKKEDSSNHQMMNAVSLSMLGGLHFYPKPESSLPDLSSAPLNTDEDFNKLRCDFYKNGYLGFQIYDIKRLVHVNFLIEKDHELVMSEAYNLINILLTREPVASSE